MLRNWPWWLTFCLLSITIGLFWLLSRDLSLSRAELEKVPAAAKSK
jgi:hypothetical protein